jgi:hypothetical protein
MFGARQHMKEVRPCGWRVTPGDVKTLLIERRGGEAGSSFGMSTDVEREEKNPPCMVDGRVVEPIVSVAHRMVVRSHAR